MPSHVARASATRSPMSSPLSAFDAGADGNAIGLLLLERAALPFGIGARRFVGGEPLANDVRRVLEVGLDRVLDVGIGKQLHPRHAPGGVRLAQLGEIGSRREVAHRGNHVARLLLIRFLVGRTGLGRHGRRLRPPSTASAPSSAPPWCAPFRRSTSASRSTGFDRRSIAATAASACSPRSATPSISAASLKRSIATSRAPASAAWRAMLPSDFSSRTAAIAARRTSSGPAALATCASSRSRPSEASAATAVIATPASCFDACSTSWPSAWSRTLPSDSLRTMSASTEASPIRATATRRTRASVSSLANAFSDSMSAGSSS